jgi:transcription antitermination protein NusB
MQFLFAHDLHGIVSDADHTAFWEMHMAKENVRAYAEELVKGILAHQSELDQLISSVLENFSFERLGVVDRNILRLGLYELLYTDVPHPVVINEAIEIARDFGDTKTRKFVNGILDRLAKSLPQRPVPAIENPAS